MVYGVTFDKQPGQSGSRPVLLKQGLYGEGEEILTVGVPQSPFKPILNLEAVAYAEIRQDDYSANSRVLVRDGERKKSPSLDKPHLNVEMTLGGLVFEMCHQDAIIVAKIVKPPADRDSYGLKDPETLQFFSVRAKGRVPADFQTTLSDLKQKVYENWQLDKITENMRKMKHDPRTDTLTIYEKLAALSGPNRDEIEEMIENAYKSQHLK